MGLRLDVADPNPSRKPNWDTKSSSTADSLRVTTCKLCPNGVYKGQAKKWGTGVDLPIGWSHTWCVEQDGGVSDG